MAATFSKYFRRKKTRAEIRVPVESRADSENGGGHYSRSHLATPDQGLSTPIGRYNQFPAQQSSMPANYVEILAAYLQQQEQIRMLNHQIQTQQLHQLPLQQLQLGSFDPIFSQISKLKVTSVHLYFL